MSKMIKMGEHPPKFCPECGGTKIGYVLCWRHSNWMTEPSNPDWEPLRGTIYDTYCYDCETSFDICPDKEMNVYYFDEYPDEIPEGGNKIYNDILLKRSYEYDGDTMRCGNCKNFYSGTSPTEDSMYFKIEVYCELDKELHVRYYRPCAHELSKFVMKEKEQ